MDKTAETVKYVSDVKYDRHLLHLSDVHLDPNRQEEYTEVIGKLHALAAEFPYRDKLIIVITGDIFDHKTAYSPTEVTMYAGLVDGLARVAPCVIIPGNHDGNLNCTEQTDLITPVVNLAKNSNVHYFRDSGYYEVCGVPFYHLSVFDPRTAAAISKFIDEEQERVKSTVLLYHGPFDSSPRTKLTKMDAVKFLVGCLGDNHEHQYLAPNVAYAGALLQRTVAESMTKGVICWNLQEKHSVFLRIPNSRGMIKLDLSGKTQEECVKIIAECKMPNVVTKVAVVCDGANEVAVKEAMVNACGRIDRVIHPVKIINPSVDVLNALKELLTTEGADPETIDAILKRQSMLMDSHDQPSERWSVVSLEWDNLLRYGPGNRINFDTVRGLAGVIAANEKGKTSLVDILVFALFGEYLRGRRENYIRYGCHNSRVKVVFMVGQTRYYIERIDDTVKTTKITFCVEESARTSAGSSQSWKNITGKSVAHVYAAVTKLIGTVNDFLSTGLYYEARDDICFSTKTERMKLLPSLFGVKNNEEILKVLRTDMSVLKTELNTLQRPRDYTGCDHTASIAALNEEKRKCEEQVELAKAALAKCTAGYFETRSVADINKSIAHVANLLCVAERDLAGLIKVNLEAKAVDPVSCTQADIERAKELLPIPSADLAVCIQCALSKISMLGKHKLTDLQAAEKAAIAAVGVLQATLVAKKNAPADMDHKLYIAGLSLKYHPACPCCIANEALLDVKNVVIANATTDTKLSVETLASKLASKQTELSTITAQIEQTKTRIKLEAELAELNKQKDAAVKIEIARDRATRYAQHVEWQALLRHKSLTAVVESHKATLAKHRDDLQVAINKENHAVLVKEAQTALATAKSKLDEVNNALIDCHVKQKIYDSETLIREEWNARQPTLVKQINQLKQHICCLGSAGLRTFVVKKNIDEVLRAANDLLAGHSFTLETQIDDSGVSIMIRKGALLQPVTMGSGFQKFAASLVLRLALCAVLPQTADFIIYDEGFGVADKSNIAKINDLFAEVKSKYKFMFVVSHVDSLQASIEQPFFIVDNADDRGVFSMLSTTMSAPTEFVKSHPPAAVVRPAESVQSAEFDPRTHVRCLLCEQTMKKGSYKGHVRSKAHVEKEAKAAR